jgi:hypothetical protein
LTIPGLPFDTFGRKPNYAFEKPWLLDAFDQVIFYRVTRPEFDRVKQLFEMGVYRLEESQYTFDLASYVDLVQSTKSEVKLIREKQEAAARVELARLVQDKLDGTGKTTDPCDPKGKPAP